MFFLFVALFILVPLVEFVVLVKVGSAIGLFPTVLIALGTAVLGVSLSRKQGFQVMHQIRQETASGHTPAQSLVEAVCILLAGLVLMTPGFVTDAIGFALLIPSVRRRLYGVLQETISLSVKNGRSSGPFQGASNTHSSRGEGEVQSSWRVLSTQDTDSFDSKN
jgi:UPF0716 protein FxsA